MSSIQQNREIEIITPLGADILLLREITVTEELGRLFSINVEMGSTQDISFEKLLGQNVSIRLNFAQGKRYFNGFVSSISQGVGEGRFARYHATIHPWLWFLTRTSDCKIFQNKTVPDIIKEILKEHGFSDIVNRLKGSYRTWDYCVQYRETDFNFISRLMEQEGIYYYFMHEQGKHTLYLADDMASHDKMSDCYTISYYPPDQAVIREDECISGWHITKQLQSGAYCLNEYDFERPKADLNANSTIVRNHSKADFEIYDYPGEYVKSSDGNQYAKIRIQELQSQYERMQGNGNVRGLICGGLFKLSLFPRSDQNREYLVTSVTHSVRIENFESTTGGSGNQYSNSFTVIESSTPYRTVRSTPKPFVQGPQTAVVVGPSGEEIYTDEHGRVKTQFHWDRYGQFNENSSCWIRVSQVHAGKGFGGVDIPRIGEEVIVSFEEGDPDRPLITGRVYNGENKAPNDLPAKKMVSGLKSNSTPGSGGNNSIMLDDSKGKEQVAINAQYNMDTAVGNNRTTKIHVDDSQTVGSNQTISIGSKQKITVTSNRDEFVGGTETIVVTGHRTETVNSGETVTVNGGRSHTVNGIQTTTVSLAEMHSVGAGRMHNVGAAEAVNVGGAQTVSVGGAQMVSVGGLQKVNVGALQSISVGGPHKLSAAVINETSKGPYKIKAGATYLVEAPTIILKAGGSKIIMNSSGITIKGSKITIKSSGSASFTASGSIKVKGSNLGED